MSRISKNMCQHKIDTSNMEKPNEVTDIFIFTVNSHVFFPFDNYFLL